MTIQKTNNYNMFKIREDNRALCPTHITHLKESIRLKNLLESRPIIVNKDMELLDGQHRLEAARQLGLPVFYEVRTDLEADDILLMNISRSWISSDYLNYYVCNGYREYIKLDSFCLKNNVPLGLAINLACGQAHEVLNKFKKGEFIFNMRFTDDVIMWIKETINYIKQVKGSCNWVNGIRFWRALGMLFTHPSFNYARWKKCLETKISIMGPKPNMAEFVSMIQVVYNFNHMRTISLNNEIV